MIDQVEDHYHYDYQNRLGLKLIELNDNHSGVVIGALQTFTHLSIIIFKYSHHQFNHSLSIDHDDSFDDMMKVQWSDIIIQSSQQQTISLSSVCYLPFSFG